MPEERCSCGLPFWVVSPHAAARPGVVIPSPTRARVCKSCDGGALATAVRNERSVI